MCQLIGSRCGIAVGCIAMMLPLAWVDAQNGDAIPPPARQAEFLNRGLVAVKTDAAVFLSWRLLGNESYRTGFNIYRDGKKLNRKPLTATTNYLDSTGATTSIYSVRAVINGREQPSAPMSVAARALGKGGSCSMDDNGVGLDPLTSDVSTLKKHNGCASDSAVVWDRPYLPIPLTKPAGGVTPAGEIYSYRPNDVSVGDLDGDGEYEIVLKWDPTNQKDNSQSGYTGEVFLDAYKLDGTFMWRISLGRNIRAGAHYTQFMVYDFDGDGKAEVAMKTADGTTDALGTVIGDANADYRTVNGYILTGPEFLTMFDGATGEALATIDYIPPRGSVQAWGDSYGNRVDRFLGGVAYLDGRHPSLIMSRGYYTRSVLAAWDWKHGEFVQRWVFDSDIAGAEYR